MTQIVCLSSAPWHSIPTRTQQLMTRMKDAQILFFEPPAPRGSHEHKKGGRKVRPGITVFTLPPIFAVGTNRPILFRLNQRKLGDYIQSVMKRHSVREPLLWCTCPENFHLLDFLAYKGLVYDCDRYWTGLPLTWESDLALAADVIFAASAGLVDRLTPCCDNIALLPNGCNYPMFSRNDVDVPQCLQDAPRPILGYAGTLWSDLDFSPVLAGARAHPDWTFLLLGAQEPSPGLREVAELPNVILPGRRPLIEVPDFVSCYSVCMALRRTGVAGNDVVSTRLYEYLSAGKPVVCHTFPGQVADFPDLTYSAPDPHGFVAQCEIALREDGPWPAGRRRDMGEASAWDCRAELVMKILDGNGLY